ncbi:hypothetical protein [Ruixingdingia sedimenti]|uniref:Uncharacterized protein n=1 Tax=Ruixingdingia sedimenti TaxID=3073604 RepID=A0ABU1FD45_9RHOB|nr:hypothetical protein [Xinfangfangia sp. LG-4]MDR5654786.1 hypothetical protein [Xinfangfangia sp. LG-4]
MRLLSAVASWAFVLSGSFVAAHPACDLKAGERVQVDDLDAFLDAVEGAAVQKDEFETTEQFEQRKAKAALTSPGFALDILTDQEHAVYDADRSTWTFREFFLSGGTYNFDDEALAEAGLANAGWSYSKMLRSSDVALGSYVASNAYGSEVLVAKGLATRTGIIEIAWGHPLPSDYMARFDPKFQMPLTLRLPAAGLPDGLEMSAFEVPMSVGEARLAKGGFRFVVAGELAEPFRITYTRHIFPKIDNPRDVTVEMTYLIADIQCGILADQEGRVLTVLPTVAPF